MSEPLAHVRAGRRTGHAVITIERNGRTQRHKVSLKRYRAFFWWTIRRCPWKCSGSWARHGIDITIWNRPYGDAA